MHNSSYCFMQIFSKLNRCFSHGLKICMWFGYNAQIIFCHFFRMLNLVFSSGIFTRCWVPCVRNSSYSFVPILLKLHRCYGHGRKICMWFAYNPQIIFFCMLNLVIFQAFLLSKLIDSGYLVWIAQHLVKQSNTQNNICRIVRKPLRGSRSDPTQTELYSHRRWLEA